LLRKSLAISYPFYEFANVEIGILIKKMGIEKNQVKVNVRWTDSAGIEFTYDNRTMEQ
jgi:hypothetical protein